MKTGLVLEGGAMRGMYTAGVLDVFMENHIQVDEVVGVSAGALFGVNYLSGQKGRVIRYNKKYNQDRNYMGLRPLIREGNIVSTKYAYEDVVRTLDPFDNDSFRKSNIPFFAVVTNVNSGKPEYMQIHSVFEQIDALRASGSMPFVSKPVEIGGKLYLDGGISDSIPYQWLLNHGCDKLIIVLTRDCNYRKQPMSPIIIRHFFRKNKMLMQTLLQRHQTYNTSLEKIEELEKQGRALVIRPSVPIEIKRIEKNPDKLQDVYNLGVKDTTELLGKIIQYI